MSGVSNAYAHQNLPLTFWHRFRPTGRMFSRRRRWHTGSIKGIGVWKTRQAGRKNIRKTEIAGRSVHQDAICAGYRIKEEVK
jgi:hypothetical protein